MTVHTLSLPYQVLTRAPGRCPEYPKGIACVVVEPVAGNMGVVPPSPGFLEGL